MTNPPPAPPAHPRSHRNFSYSGSDFSIWSYFPIDGQPGQTQAGSSIVPFGNLQTVSSSYASALSAVHSVGSSLPTGHTRGPKTFAGSLIFTVFDAEPLQHLLTFSKFKNSPDADKRSQYLTIDQIPEFNIVIQGCTELPTVRGIPQVIVKVIIGVRLMTHGETISVDDFFLEQTHQYVARWISPWLKVAANTVGIAIGLNTLRDMFHTAVNKNYDFNSRAAEAVNPFQILI